MFASAQLEILGRRATTRVRTLLDYIETLDLSYFGTRYRDAQYLGCSEASKRKQSLPAVLQFYASSIDRSFDTKSINT